MAQKEDVNSFLNSQPTWNWSADTGKKLEELIKKLFPSDADTNYKCRIAYESEKDDYFGILDKNAADSGEYQGLSFVLFPVFPNAPSHTASVSLADSTGSASPAYYAVTLNVGLDGYGNDGLLAQRPGTRRTLRQLIHLCQDLCCTNRQFDPDAQPKRAVFNYKLNFRDNKSNVDAAYRVLKKSCIPSKYNKSTLAYVLADLNTEKGRLLMLKFLVWYGKLRDWTRINELDKALGDLPEPSASKEKSLTANDREQQAVEALLKEQRFVVLQGAPGTGKTRLARKIAKDAGGEVFFIQFHAETTYSDFIYGLVPDTSADAKEVGLRFKEKEGVFLKAIRAALAASEENGTQKDIYLIIDEINRANLSNVLGEAFYLFEKSRTDDSEKGSPKVALGNPEKPLELSGLPAKLYVIATMNTADRSLAVVDFALRRRFAWYTLEPRALDKNCLDKGYQFCKEEFNDLSEIFDTYATDDELNLKPGQSYFIVKNKDDMHARLRYELLPLIREYLLAGMLADAANNFSSYFRNYGVEEELFR